MINRRYLFSRDVGPSDRKGKAWITLLLIVIVIALVVWGCRRWTS